MVAFIKSEGGRRLQGRKALVTGASRGIGRSIAKAFVEEGADVALVARSEESLREFAEELRELIGKRNSSQLVFTGCFDVGDSRQVEGIVSWVESLCGCPDIVVHAAGHQLVKPAVAFGLDEWERLIRVHLTAAFILGRSLAAKVYENSELVLPVGPDVSSNEAHLLEEDARPGFNLARGGVKSNVEDRSLIFIGSLTSERMATAGTVGYNVAKSGLMGLVRTLALEWADIGIRVNAILPGFFRTEMTSVLDGTELGHQLTRRIPMRRWGYPDELGSLAVYLASPESSYVTGSAITIDGGFSVA